MTTHRHHRRYRRSAGYNDGPEVCDVTKRVVCEKIPIIEEVVKDVEVCESLPREVMILKAW